MSAGHRSPTTLCLWSEGTTSTPQPPGPNRTPSSALPWLGPLRTVRYYARNDREVDDLAADQLERFPVLALFGISKLEAHGFKVVATFRTPHVTVAFEGDLSSRLVELATLARRSMPNPYHEAEPNDPPLR